MYHVPRMPDRVSRECNLRRGGFASRQVALDRDQCRARAPSADHRGKAGSSSECRNEEGELRILKMSEPQIAIVGSGPSGFFAAEAVLKSGAAARVDMFDRLPTPYGLVRSGVAPDHQEIKQVVKIFDALAKNTKFGFFGNVEVGSDISLDALRS